MPATDKTAAVQNQDGPDAAAEARDAEAPVFAVVVAPHPDDAEIGAGGVIARLTRQGLPVAVLDLTNGEPTPMGSVPVRMEESRRAAQILGLARRVTLDLPNRYLQDTVSARQEVAGWYRRWRPRVLFLPYWEDAHPDHVAACRLGEAARFYAKFTHTDLPGEPHWIPKVFYYFSCHWNLVEPAALVVDISAVWPVKLAAVQAYASQFNAVRGNLDFLDRLGTRAAYWGQLIQSQYGEPLASREPVGVKDLSAVL